MENSNRKRKLSDDEISEPPDETDSARSSHSDAFSNESGCSEQILSLTNNDTSKIHERDLTRTLDISREAISLDEKNLF